MRMVRMQMPHSRKGEAAGEAAVAKRMPEPPAELLARRATIKPTMPEPPWVLAAAAEDGAR